MLREIVDVIGKLGGGCGVRGGLPSLLPMSVPPELPGSCKSAWLSQLDQGRPARWPQKEALSLISSPDSPSQVREGWSNVSL